MEAALPKDARIEKFAPSQCSRWHDETRRWVVRQTNQVAHIYPQNRLSSNFKRLQAIVAISSPISIRACVFVTDLNPFNSSLRYVEIQYRSTHPTNGFEVILIQRWGPSRDDPSLYQPSISTNERALDCSIVHGPIPRPCITHPACA